MNKSNYIKMSLAAAAIATISTGCSNKDSVSVENNGVSGENFHQIKAKKSMYEKRKASNFISIKNKSVSKVLELLSDHDMKTHILEGDDIVLPSKKYKVSTLRDLQQFIEMFTGMRLVKEKESERLVKWKLKSYELNPFNKEFKMDFSGDKVKVNKILKEIGKNTGYSIISKKDVVEDLNKEIEIEFNGKTIKNFTDYIAKYNNMYVDVDHKLKTITISKYKHTIFDIPVSVPTLNLEKKISSGGDTTSGGFGGGTVNTTVSQEIDVYDELDKYLSLVLIEDLTLIATGETNKNTYFIQKSIGKVYVNADASTLEKVSEIVNNFKSNLEIGINISVAVYTVDLTDESSYGIDWNVIKNTAAGVLTGGTSNIMTVAPTTTNLLAGATSPLEQASTAILGNIAPTDTGFIGGSTSLGGSTGIAAVLNMAGKYGDISDVQKFNVSTINNFPTIQVISRKNPYLKSITNEIVANDTGNNTIVTTPEFGEVDSGIFFYINAKTFKDSEKISLNFSPMFNKLEGFETIEFGNNESSSQPVTSLQSFNNNIIMNDGEQILITGIITDRMETNYKGMNPGAAASGNMLNSLTGINGAKSNKQEIFILLTATKEKR